MSSGVSHNNDTPVFKQAMKWILNKQSIDFCFYNLCIALQDLMVYDLYFTFLTTSSMARAKYCTLLSFNPLIEIRPFETR